jgi:hypothetical protein
MSNQQETNTMTTIVAPHIKSERSDSGQWPTLDREPADTRRQEPEAHSFDPTQGRKLGSDASDDPTQGRRIGADPYDDPTRAR